MSETANSGSDAISTEAEKPVQCNDDVNLPLFPDPTDDDFDEDISNEEKEFYKLKFLDLNAIRNVRLHCTACDRHMGSSARSESRMRIHPMLKTLMCHTCHSFYNSGEFEKGEDGSELYCRWCGQGGQVYCCSDCPHVFCAKCIKRNLGQPKIKEIENTDDWKCFRCNSKSLWELRAVCWALLRYCDLLNKMVHQADDKILKEKYLAICSTDYSECCKMKQNKRKEREAKKKEDAAKKASTASVISKIPPTIQVKKFASINLEESSTLSTPTKNIEKKGTKRPMSPKKVYMKNPIPVASCAKVINPIAVPPLAKKIRMPALVNAIRLPKDRYSVLSPQFPRIRPRPPTLSVSYLNNQFNGFNTTGMYHSPINDNINLSLDSLTQGLDMAAVSRLSNHPREDDVVCTPDFPLEPLCEVTEDNTDDDVQCITPAPMTVPKVATPPPLQARTGNMNDMPGDNIIQMTDNDVTVNSLTGGLKFRVDPQTLSSNKMYRLPDGRIFAINANPNMPGGYSATIVALSENNVSKPPPKSSTYAAKLSTVPSPNVPPPLVRTYTATTSKRTTNKVSKASKNKESRECDLDVPVEWYRYNLIDAVDALEYSLSRLNKLKNEATTLHLRTRNVMEMRNLHKTLDRLLTTSSTRFNEIRESLSKEMRQYVLKKSGSVLDQVSDDDDDVEILNDLDDDPIFIDENSMESTTNNTNEVDLTIASSEHNESGEKIVQDSVSNEVSRTKDISFKSTADTTNIELNSSGDDKISADCSMQVNGNDADVTSVDDGSEPVNNNELLKSTSTENTVANDILENKVEALVKVETLHKEETLEKVKTLEKVESTETDNVSSKKEIAETNTEVHSTKMDKIKHEEEKEKENSAVVDKLQESEISESKLDESEFNDKIDDIEMSEDKSQDAEMSEEMIETLLKDDSGGDETNTQNSKSLDTAEEIKGL